MTPATFRANFPEFSCTQDYPDSTIEFWFTVADGLLNPERWANLYEYGTQLIVAHHLAIASRDQQAAHSGGIPGTVQGVQSSKSVDKVSVSYDTKAVTNENEAFWNMTTYGIRLSHLSRMVGAGGVQL